MEIIKITSDIASSASKVYALSWKTAYKNIVPQEYLNALSLERWTPFLQYSPYEGFVLRISEEFVATSSIAPARDKAMLGWGEIISIYVLPNHFFKGYGKKLLLFVITELQNKGFDNIYLWVLEDNQQAKIFYERNGFIDNGDRSIITIGGKELVEARYVYTAK